MTPDEVRILSEHITPLHVFLAAVAGLQAGAIYAFASHLGTRLFHSTVMSSMFFLPLLVATALVQNRTWIVWLGLWGLWTVFSVGNAVGYRLRTRYEAHRRLKKR
jgi:hypothetical protein